jgi:hypothetical protein
MEDNCETITNFKGRESYGIILKLPKNYTAMKKKHMNQDSCETITNFKGVLKKLRLYFKILKEFFYLPCFFGH